MRKYALMQMFLSKEGKPNNFRCNTLYFAKNTNILHGNL